MKKKFLGLWLALALVLSPLAACSPGRAPACPAGQVAENDDDGWECEPDEDGNGVDDEEDEEGSGSLFGKKRKKKVSSSKPAVVRTKSTSKRR